MNIAVIGTGYVGLVTATCFAESGNCVVGVDVSEEKIATLTRGELPIYEPGLLDLVKRNRAAGRLRFSLDYEESVANSELIFLAVGTPQDESGHADLRYMWSAADSIAQVLTGSKIVVVKSTVPVGTNKRLQQRFDRAANHPVEVVSNPEFLKEGTALEDFQKPDRVVVGVRRRETADLLRELYAPFLRTERPFLVMSPESAEMTKYAANALLATKISFINEVANLSERLDANINDVRRGIGHDRRIGFQFLFPGPGWGGSCFPKDIQALTAQARGAEMPMRILESVQQVNEQQKLVLPGKIRDYFASGLAGKTLAVWGLAFKPRTDDVREAPALTLIDEMLTAKVKLRVHDPEAMTNVANIYRGQLEYCRCPYQALDNADGLAIVTEWAEYRHPNFAQMRERLRAPVVFDGRNLFEPQAMHDLGFTYHSIGRRPAEPNQPTQAAA